MKRNGLRLLSAVLALMMVLVLLPVTAAQADEVVEIGDYDALKNFAALVNGGNTRLSARLTANIVCTDKMWTPIGMDADHAYEGKFDGQGYAIIGLSNADVVYSGSGTYDAVSIGLFGIVTRDGTVENTMITDCDLSFVSDTEEMQAGVGAIAGSGGCTIENCYVTGNLHAEAAHPYVGGIVGAHYGTIQNCCSAATVSGGNNAMVGGITGYTNHTVQNCYNTGTVSGGDVAKVGGVVGYVYGAVQNCYNTGSVSGGENTSVGGVGGNVTGMVQNCYNTGSVSVSYGQNAAVGGIAGDNSYIVQNCFNVGAVFSEGNADVGGIAGKNAGTVKICLNVGSVSHGYNVGGIAGSVNSGTVENCLNTGAASDCLMAGGIAGDNSYGTVTSCLNVGALSASQYVGGAVGYSPYSNTDTFVKNCYWLDTTASGAIGSPGSATVTDSEALTADALKSMNNCGGFSADVWAEGLFYPVLKNYAASIHLYANSDEDLVIEGLLSAYAPTKIRNPFSWTGYLFTGWNTKADGTGVPYSADAAITLLPDKSLTLYAQWEKEKPVGITSYADLKAFAARVNAGEYGLCAEIMNDFVCKNDPLYRHVRRTGARDHRAFHR